MIVIANLFSYGQEYNKYCLYTDYAVKAYETGNYEQAISLMDSAISQCKEQNEDAANWYNLSLFYRTLYKKNKDISLRTKMLNSILHAQGLDHENELEKPINSFIKAIANYYLNDAVKILEDTSSNFSGALENYEKHKTTLLLIEPNIDFKKEDIRFYNSLASRNDIKYYNNKTLYANFLDSTIHYYSKSLLLDSNQFNTQKELGIIYFNQAVDIINNLDPEADLEVVMVTDAKKVELALKSIPYFKKSLALNESDTKLYYSLAGCYDILQLVDQKEIYMKALKEKDPEFYKSVLTFD